MLRVGSILLAVCVLATSGSAAAEELMDRFSPEQQDVLNLLRRNRQTYGDDTTLLQGLLLVNAVHSDAVLATECNIEGFEEVGDRTFVTLRLASGIIFNDRETDRMSRLESVWHTILERTLLRYPTFSLPADGLTVEIEYNHRPYGSSSDVYRHVDDPGPPEEATFTFLAEDLKRFVERDLEDQEFLHRSKIELDGEPVTLKLRQPIRQYPRKPPGLNGD